MKLVCHLPIHPREGLTPPYGFVHNAICNFLLQRHADKELLICDDPGSRFDIGAAIARARKACAGKIVGTDGMTTFYGPTQFLGAKRNLMMAHTDGDVAVFMDDDDIYLPDYLPTIANHLATHPGCPGAMNGATVWYYIMVTGRYGRKSLMGGSNQVLRVPIMRQLVAAGVQYPEAKRVASDSAFMRAVKWYDQPLTIDGVTYRKGRAPTAQGAGDGQAHGVYANSGIPGMGAHTIVLRLPDGHTSASFGKIAQEAFDRQGTWLLAQAPEPCRPFLRALVHRYQNSPAPDRPPAAPRPPFRPPAKTDWFLQRKAFALGNFLIATPALRDLAQQRGHPIRVHFESPYLATLYQDAQFLQICRHRPQGPPRWVTCGLNDHRQAGETDAECFYRLIMGRPKPGVWQTYIDRPPAPKDLPTGPNVVAVMHGGVGKYWPTVKTLPVETRAAMLAEPLQAGFIPVRLGSMNDRKRYWQDVPFPRDAVDLIDRPIREQLGVLATCGFFVANDTGIAQAAAALGVPGVFLWKQSAPDRFALPFPHVEHFQDTAGRHEAYLPVIRRWVAGEGRPGTGRDAMVGWQGGPMSMGGSAAKPKPAPSPKAVPAVHAAKPPERQTILVAGIPRSGTSWLYRSLAGLEQFAKYPLKPKVAGMADTHALAPAALPDGTRAIFIFGDPIHSVISTRERMWNPRHFRNCGCERDPDQVDIYREDALNYEAMFDTWTGPHPYPVLCLRYEKAPACIDQIQGFLRRPVRLLPWRPRVTRLDGVAPQDLAAIRTTYAGLIRKIRDAPDAWIAGGTT